MSHYEVVMSIPVAEEHPDARALDCSLRQPRVTPAQPSSCLWPVNHFAWELEVKVYITALNGVGPRSLVSISTLSV